MKEILTEFDLLQEAMKKIDMNEVAMPIHNGKIVENKESYCKMQQILNAPEMIKSHAFILNLDPEQLEEDEIERVDKLWNLGVNRGFITADGDEKTDNEIVSREIQDTKPAPEEKAPESSFAYKSQKVDVPCWTILYSATDKNGDIKTGECYSNAINTRSAKADCYAKLERCGYSNIAILAIEAGDPDNCENNTMLLGKDDRPSNDETDKVVVDAANEEIANESEEDEVEEADTSFDELKSAHSSGTKEEVTYTKDGEEEVEVAGPTDDEKDAEGADYKTLYSEFLTAADDYEQIVNLQGENSNAAKNAFKEVQGAYEDCYAAVPSKADEQELLSQVNSYGFKLAGDNCTILEGEEEMVDESGNPYLAGMKTADLNGQMKVSTKGPAKPKKAAAKKTKIEEDDEDSSDDKSDDSDSEDNSDSESEDTSSDESSDDNSGDSDNSSDDDSSDDNEDDSDNEEVSDDSGDDSEEDNDSDDSEESNDEESDETEDDESADSDDDSDDEKDEEDSDEDGDSDEDSGDEESDDEETDDEETEEKESKELSDEEKAQYKSDYKKTFKDTMLKCKFEDKCFDDLSIAEKVEFFTKLQKAWKKNEPKDFMSDKEIEQLNKVTAKK